MEEENTTEHEPLQNEVREVGTEAGISPPLGLDEPWAEGQDIGPGAGSASARISELASVAEHPREGSKSNIELPRPTDSEWTAVASAKNKRKKQRKGATDPSSSSDMVCQDYWTMQG